MHIAINAWFYNRPDTGSGQYVRNLVDAFIAARHPDLRLTLIVPEGWDFLTPDGVAIERAPLSGSGNWAKLRFEQFGFPASAKRIGADLAHVPYWGSPISSLIPVVVTIHDLIPMLLPEYRGGLLARLYTSVVAASAGGAAAVITDSVASAQDIAEHLHIHADSIFPIPLAAGADYHPRQGSLVDMAIRKKYSIPPGEFVLYLGGYDVRKNIATLLKAYTYVRKGYDAPLILAGRPPQKSSPRFIDVQPLIDQMGLSDIVQIIGEVDEADKPALYRLATTFVFPSRYEGFGLPVLEAMASGTAVVTTDTSSLAEIVGDAAFVVQPDDARHMAGSILATLTQPETNKDLSERGLRRAAEFSWARTAAETYSVYRQVLGQSDTQ
jgi:glycosyltransferase involved in cell wall biosynthesis